MPRALDGITVFDISVGEACALATMMLSDNGARVIRVSNPEDERRRNSQTYRMLDRGKESVHLDLNQALKEFSKTDTTADETAIGHCSQKCHCDYLMLAICYYPKRRQRGVNAPPAQKPS